MTPVVLVAVNDSEAAFTAARVAVDYARLLGARLHAVTVIEPWVPDRRLGDTDASALAARRELAAQAALRHVAGLGTAAGVEVSGVRREAGVAGVAGVVLDEARAVDATLIVMARVSRPGHALPTIGSQALRVLEFTTVPVLIVPTRPQ